MKPLPMRHLLPCLFFCLIFHLFSSQTLAQCSFTVTATPVHVNCYNGTTGSITVNVTGGTAPYAYQLAEAGAGAWQSGNTFTALTANTYPVSVRDATGCIKTIYVAINQSAPLVANYAIAPASCSGANNAAISINTTGGTTPYGYSWTRNGSAYATTASITNLSPGNYLLTVTDARGCTVSPIVTSEMKPVTLSGFTTDVIANGTGNATASSSGALDNGPGGNAYYVTGYNNGSSTGTGGLPATGLFSSVQDATRQYQLASYSANNSLVLRSASNPDLSTGATSGTLTFATQNKSLYSSLYVVGSTGNGTGVTNYTVHYTDGGSTYTGSLNFPDWFLDPSTASSNRALGNLDRVARDGGSAFTGSSNFNLFEAPITIPVGDQGRVIDRIDFAWGSADNARINLFAITGYTSTAYGIRVNDGPASNVAPIVTLTSDAASNQFCSGQSVTFTAVPQFTGSAPTYQWYRNSTLIGGASSATYTTSTLANNDIISVTVTAGGTGIGCLSTSTASGSATMVLATRTAGVSIATGSTTVCAASPVLFTASPVNGGATPSFQWRVNGGNAGAPTASSTYSSSSLASGDIVSVIMTSSIGCATNNPATSNTIPMTVLPIGEPSVTITSVPAVTFSSTTNFGGSIPGYQWYRNGVAIPGANAATYTTASATIGQQYSLKLTSNYACQTAPAAMSNYITVNFATLPVKLESFTAQGLQNTVELQWKTSFEENVANFKVQRSLTGNSDDFKDIGIVNAENKASGSVYSFIDKDELSGTVFYRLAMIDRDGRKEYSAVKPVQVQVALRVADQGHAWFIQNTSPLQYILMNAQGQVLRRGNTASSLTLEKPAAHGVYILQIATRGQSLSFRLSAH